MSGVMVPTIWRARKQERRPKEPLGEPSRPIRHSHVASTGSEMSGPTHPKGQALDSAGGQALGGTEARNELQRTKP